LLNWQLKAQCPFRAGDRKVLNGTEKGGLFNYASKGIAMFGLQCFRFGGSLCTERMKLGMYHELTE
jgi:hypothetical protein